MKNRIIYLMLMSVVPSFGLAQVDDMYFVPKKETKVVSREVKEPQQVQLKEANDAFVFTENDTFSEENTRDVDEYNRRYYYNSPADTVLVDGEEIEEERANGFQGGDTDYAYTKRLLRFYTPSVGIPVSSPLYWDLCYGPGSIYWDVYDDGVYAYAFPSSWNSLYYGPYFSFSWGWHPYYSYWGWRYPWYGGWYGHHWHHYPHWGAHPGGVVGGNHRPISLPSVRYRENSTLARGRTRETSTGRLSSTARAVRKNSTATSRNSNVPRRSSGQETSVRSNSTNSYTRSTNRASRSTFSNSGSGSMRSGGGFSPSRSGGAVSRGRR